MRALCGAIITAGSLIGLGLLCIGFGLRYHDKSTLPADHAFVWFRDLDTPLMLAFVILVASLLIGLGLAFAGLAYHHHHRHHELMHLMRGGHKDRPADRIPV
jgi:hypothetical protein